MEATVRRSLRCELARAGFFTVLLLGGTGCSVGPDYIPPEIPMPETYLDSGGASTEEVTSSWWRGFSDAVLDDLISRAVASNKSLEVAVSRVNEARAQRREAIFELLPHGNVGAEYSNNKQPAVRYGDFLQQGIDYEAYSVGFDAFWEIDILGRRRRFLEVRSAEAEAARASLEDAVRILIAEVGRNYFELRGFQAQLDVALRNVQNQTEVLQVVKAKEAAGAGTELDTVRAEALLSTTRAVAAPLEGAAKRAMNALAILLGVQPHEVRPLLETRRPVPAYAGPLTLGAPTDLLRRRPDVRVAERGLAASVAGIGVATGELFPIVTFSGTLGYEAASPDDLGRAGTEGYSFGPRIQWAALDLGRVYAKIDAADARAQGALKLYELSVLTALEETSSALATLHSAQQRVEELRRGVRFNRRAVELSVTGYQAGAIDFLTLLEAQRSLLLVEAELAGSEANYATALVALYKALGGGWEEFPVVRAEQPK